MQSLAIILLVIFAQCTPPAKFQGRLTNCLHFPINYQYATCRVNRMGPENSVVNWKQIGPLQSGIIPPQNSTNVGLQNIDPPTKDTQTLLNVWYEFNGKRQNILNLQSIRDEETIRVAFWLQDGAINYREILPEPEMYRLTNGSTRNYPPGHKCPVCGQEQVCKKGCSEQSKYGGKVSS